MADFICMGLLDRELQNDFFFCPQLDSNPGHFAYEANTLSVALLGEISIEYSNFDRALPECAIKIYL